MALAGTLVVKLAADLSDLQRGLNTAVGQLGQFGNVVGRIGQLGALAGIAGTVYKIADAYKEAANATLVMEGRLRTVTRSLDDARFMMDKLFELSQATRTEWDASVQLYARMARASESLGMSRQDTLDLTKTIQQALVVSGATAQEIASVMLQYSQALSAGRFSGDELRSIIENGSRVAKAMADGLGVSIGRLREMGTQGLLTAQVVNKAMMSQRDSIEKEFMKMPVTWDQALTLMKNSWSKLLGDIERDQGALKNVIKSIQDFSVYMDENGTRWVMHFNQSIKELGERLDEVWKSLQRIGQASGLTQEQFGPNKPKPGFIQELTDEINRRLEDDRKLFDWVGRQVEALKTWTEAWKASFNDNIDKVNELRAAVAHMQDIDAQISASTKSLDERRREAEQRERERIEAVQPFIAAGKYAKGLMLGTKPPPRPTDVTGGGKGKSPEEKALDELQKLRDETERYQQLLQGLAADVTTPYEDLRRQLDSTFDTQKRITDATREHADASEATRKAIILNIEAAEAYKLELERQVAAMKDADKINDEYGSGLKEVEKKWLELQKAIGTGRVETIAQGEAVKDLTKKWQEAQIKLRWGPEVLEAVQAFEDAIVNLGTSVYDSMFTAGTSIRQFVSTFLKETGRMVFQMMVWKPLIEAFMSLVRGWGVGTPSAPTASGGAGVAPEIAGTRAIGGPVWPGASFLVGERGPEVFTPSTHGNITPGGNVGPNIVVNIDMSGGTTAQGGMDNTAALEFGRKMKAAIQDVIMNEKRPGGLLSNGVLS